MEDPRAMAYPEPIPALAGRDAEEFAKRLEAFKLSESQRALFRDAFLVFAREKGKK